MKIEKPVDIATRETLAFVTANVPAGARLLEVGCGAGQLARALLDAGYRVVALDADEGEVAQARVRGVDARCVAWLDYNGERVDAIAFTRSLHHIHPLEDAVCRAHELLNASGVLIVEDYAYEDAPDSTIQWFARIARSPEVRALLAGPAPGEMVTALIEQPDAAAAWGGRQDHDLHTWDAMSATIVRTLRVLGSHAVPYAYRYLVRVLTETPAAAALVESVLAEEVRRGQRGEIDLIGRRLVARKPG